MEDRLTSRGSCPAFNFNKVPTQESNGLSDSDLVERPHAPGKDPFAPGHVEWFKDHIEIVGAPRPERPQLQVGKQESIHKGEKDRDSAIQQVAFMAERYREGLESKKKESNARRARSSPNLTFAVEKIPSVPRKKSTSSTSSGCAACCAPVKLLQDCLAKSQLLGSRPDVGYVPGDESADNSVIIFDWDDTLLPTTFILNSVIPSLPQKEREGAVPKSSVFYEDLAAHAHLVGFVLRVARRSARVALVTNSMSPWVVASATRYLPGLDMEALLSELGIPVYYARRHVSAVSKQTTFHEEVLQIEVDHSSNARIGMDIIPAAAGNDSIRIAKINDDGLIGKWNDANPQKQVLPGDWITEVNGATTNLADECRKLRVLNITIMRAVPDRDPYMEAKRIDMESCLKTFYGDQSGQRLNVLSIGDSAAEQMAVKEVLPRTGVLSQDSLCKTVHLLMHPTTEQLSNELRILLVWLSYMVKYDKDFDLAMDRLDDLEKRLFGT